MARMTRPDCAVMCNLINTHTRTHESKVQFVGEDTRPFREGASGQNGRLNPLRMGITTEAGALLDNHPRLENKALLLDIAIVNPCVGSNLGNAARHVGRPCYPFDSHSMPLVLVTNDTYYENLWSDATKGAHSL